MLPLYRGGRAGCLEIHPDLRAGMGLIRGGAGTTLQACGREIRCQNCDAVVTVARVAGYGQLVRAGQ